MARTIMGGYKAYNFREHDVVLDQLDRLYELAGVLKRSGAPNYKLIAEKTGCKEATLMRWHNRQVRKPQHAGLKAVVQGLGGRYEMSYNGQRILAGKLVITTRQDVIARRAMGRKKKAA